MEKIEKMSVKEEKEVVGKSKHPDLKAATQGCTYAENGEYSKHGQILCGGLRGVLDFFSAYYIEGGAFDSVGGFFVFKAVLNDMSQSKEFISLVEKVGLIVQGVTDKYLVLSTLGDSFVDFLGCVVLYRDKGLNVCLRLVQEFVPFIAEDKFASNILQYKDSPDKIIDVQISLLSSNFISKKEQNRVIDKVKQVDGSAGLPYQLTDGTVIIRALVSYNNLCVLANDPCIRRVEETICYSPTSQ